MRAEITLDKREANKRTTIKAQEYDADIEEAIETEIEAGTPSPLCHQDDPQESRSLRRRRSLSQDEIQECRGSRKRLRRSTMI